jgi:hypothetical protein
MAGAVDGMAKIIDFTKTQLSWMILKSEYYDMLVASLEWKKARSPTKS